jgi:phosphatidylglycerol:prolipoprotein diacylglycerol transferase
VEAPALVSESRAAEVLVDGDAVGRLPGGGGVRLAVVPDASIPADDFSGAHAGVVHPAELLSGWLDRLAERVVLFRTGSLVFVTFGFFGALGALLVLASMGTILTGQGLGPWMFVSLALVGCVGMVAGSWLAAQLLDFRMVLANPREALLRPAFVSWGGILLLPLLLEMFSRFSGVNALLLMDGAARTVLLGCALGRLGCLSYGCCHGRPTRSVLSVTYRNPLSKAVRLSGLRGIRLHPAPLYEAAMDVGVTVVVNLAAFTGVALGVPTALAFILYGLGRFAIEFTKDNQGRMVVGRFAVNHFICLGVIGLGFWVLNWALQAPEAAPPIAWALGLGAVRDLLPAILPGALIVFLGFSMHRRRVGAW